MCTVEDDIVHQISPVNADRRPQRDGPMSKKSSRVDLACQALRQAIIEQALPPGTRLPEDELGARFGMSRTLVRAALAHLQSEGLVDAPPRRTATTARPTLEEAKQVFEVRRTLEREVVRLVIARWR